MAFGGTISQLSVSLAMNAGKFVTGTTNAQTALRGLQDRMISLGDTWTRTVKKLSVRVTLPVTGLGAGIVKVAGDFESQLNKVAISTKATAEEMEALKKTALDLGKASVFGASEAADAIDLLAKNGLTARQILDGAAKASVDLASAAGSDLAPAADAVTDVMQQFALTTKDLPNVVNQITGAVNESKLDFEDFALAIGQAGGVAGSSGVEFEDFNTVIAATSSLFASGSDAGTSFKTFLTALPGNSKAAKNAIREYGLAFFDAQGNLRSMGAIAEELRTKLGGLNEQARAEVLKEIFGTDAMRTAIGLMNQGSEGLGRVAAAIRETDAASQSAQRLKGLNGQLEELGGAIETLSIAIADTGLLSAVTSVVTSIANMISRFAEANPVILKIIVGIAALSAAMGPLLLVIGTLVAFSLPLFFGKLGLVGKAISLLINPIGTVIVALKGFIVASGGLSAALGVLNAAILRIIATLAPYLVLIGALAAAIFLLVRRNKEAAQASAVYRNESEKLKKMKDRLKDTTEKLTVATGKAREESIRAATAQRKEAQETLRNAKAQLVLARNKAIQARTDAKIERDRQKAPSSFSSVGLSGRTGQLVQSEKELAQQNADLAQAYQNFDDAKELVDDLTALINAPDPNIEVNLAPLGGGDDGSSASGGSRANGSKPEPTGITLAELESRFLTDIERLQMEELEARRRATLNADDRADLSLELLVLEATQRRRQLEEQFAAARKDVEESEKLTAAEKTQALAYLDSQKKAQAAIIDELYGVATNIAENGEIIVSPKEGLYPADVRREVEEEYARQAEEMARIEFDQRRDMLEISYDLADTQAERKRIALEILALEQEFRRLELEKVLASKTATDAMKAQAQALLDGLAAIEAGEQAVVGRANETDLERYRRGLNKSPEQMQEEVDGIGIRGLESLNDGLAEALSKIDSIKGAFKSMGEVFKNVAAQILQDLIRLQIQQALIKPLANSLGFSIPAFARGTNYAPGGLSLVGENGPELVDLRRGARVYTNEDTNKILGGNGGTTVNMTVKTNDPDGFRRNQRQINRETKRRLDF